MAYNKLLRTIATKPGNIVYASTKQNCKNEVLTIIFNRLLSNGNCSPQQVLNGSATAPKYISFFPFTLTPFNYRSYRHKTIQFENCHVYRKNEYSVEINYLVKKEKDLLSLFCNL